MKDNEIRIIGGEQQKYFCRSFVANCTYFEEKTGLCDRGDCIYSSKNIPSPDEILRLQLAEIRRTQLQMAGSYLRYRTK